MKCDLNSGWVQWWGQAEWCCCWSWLTLTLILRMAMLTMTWPPSSKSLPSSLSGRPTTHWPPTSAIQSFAAWSCGILVGYWLHTVCHSKHLICSWQYWLVAMCAFLFFYLSRGWLSMMWFFWDKKPTYDVMPNEKPILGSRGVNSNGSNCASLNLDAKSG